MGYREKKIPSHRGCCPSTLSSPGGGGLTHASHPTSVAPHRLFKQKTLTPFTKLLAKLQACEESPCSQGTPPRGQHLACAHCVPSRVTPHPSGDSQRPASGDTCAGCPMTWACAVCDSFQCSLIHHDIDCFEGQWSGGL